MALPSIIDQLQCAIQIENQAGDMMSCSQQPEYKLHTRVFGVLIEYYVCKKHYKSFQLKATERRISNHRGNKRKAYMKATAGQSSNPTPGGKA
jgi:hypothetical protein